MKKLSYLFLIVILSQQINANQTGGPVIQRLGDCKSSEDCPKGEKCKMQSIISSPGGYETFEYWKCVKE